MAGLVLANAKSVTALVLLLAVMVLVQYSYVLRASIERLPLSGKDIRRTECLQSAKGGKPVGSARDCSYGRGNECTRDEPCTPCSAGGCQACTVDFSGDCGFIEGVGPYCRFAAAGSNPSYVGPCTRCCS